MLQGEDNPSVAYDLHAVKPERVVNVETGLDFARPGLSVQANAFFMEFHDEIAQTGELSETYLPLRRNVDRSSRRGVEIDLTWRPVTRGDRAALGDVQLQPDPQLDAVLRRVRRRRRLGGGRRAGRTRRDAAAHAVAAVQPVGRLHARGMGHAGRGRPVRRHVAPRQHRQRTPSRRPGFFGLDADASIDLARALPFAAAAAPRLRIQATNLLDNRRMFPSGYSYQYFTQGAGGMLNAEGTRYFYPLATRSVSASLELRF